MLINEFYDYLNERERIRINKEVKKLPWPWTSDPILQTYSFTNLDREDDKTTRWLRSNWTVPHENHPFELQLINIATFRYFCTIEFATELGWQDDFRPDLIVATANRMMKAGRKVFTGAFVITNQGISAPKQEVVTNIFLKGIWEKRAAILKAAETRSWEETAKVVRTVEGYGGSGFMAKELLVDCYHTPILRGCVDRNTWCPAGPGARRGLNRFFGRPVDQTLNERKALEEMLFIFGERDKYLEDHVDRSKFDLHGVQFALCEFDKYLRVKLGEGRPRSKYHKRTA